MASGYSNNKSHSDEEDYAEVDVHNREKNIPPPLPPARSNTLPQKSNCRYVNTTFTLDKDLGSSGTLNEYSNGQNAGSYKRHSGVYSSRTAGSMDALDRFYSQSEKTLLHRTAGSPEREYAEFGPQRELPRTPSDFQFFSDIYCRRSWSVQTNNSFISTKTCQNAIFDELSRGIFVQERLYMPSGDLPIETDQLVRQYNEQSPMEDVQRQDIEKHVATNILQYFKTEKKNIVAMAQLLKMNSNKILDLVVAVLYEESLEMTTTVPEHLYTTLEILSTTFDKSPQAIMLVIFNLVSFIGLRHLKCAGKKEFCKRCLNRCKVTPSQKWKTFSLQIRTPHILLKTFIQQFKQFKGQTCDFFMECKMTEEVFRSMTFFEQYMFIFGVINKLYTGLPRRCDQIKLLNETVVMIVKKKQKPHSDESSKQQAMLTLVTHSCVLILKNDKYMDLQSDELMDELLKITEIILGDSNVLQEIRLSLMKIIEPLLLAENAEIVKRILYLFIKNHQSSVPLSKLVLEYISKGLINTGIKLQQNASANEQIPVWQITDGLIINENREVIVHFLVPSLQCLTNGNLNAYKSNANKDDTIMHINNLEILRHLQHESTHSLLIQLLAYQIMPWPLFYVIERMTSLTLNDYLLRMRKQSKWQQPKALAIWTVDVVSVIQYIHDKHVIQRDLTTHAFRLCDGGRRLVLHDFSIALLLEDEETSRTENGSEAIPTLWSAPESILEDRYSTKSDIWMVGQIMYEMFTHGCQPYTEMYTFNIEKVLSYVVFHHLLPKRWPCIPKEIYDLIISSVQQNPDNRTSLANVLKGLNDFIDCKNPEKKQRSQLFDDDKLYPSLDPKQGRPRRGIPHLFLDIKKQNINNSEAIYNAYMNLKIDDRSRNRDMQIEITELTSPDRPQVSLMDDQIIVEEQVTTATIDNIRAKLDMETCSNILNMSQLPNWYKADQATEYGHVLKYKMKCSTTVVDVAKSRQFGDPLDPMNVPKYLEVVLKMVQFVSAMNEKSWILGSVRASDFYFVDNEDKVVMARLGRMLWFDRSGLDDDCVIAVYDCSDYVRWCPIEVLQYKQYSFASDVYSVAMAIYEFYMTLTINQRDPMAGETECAPFPYIPLNDLQAHLYSDGRPDKPEACPENLYQLLCRCWSRDKDKRPDICELITKVQCYIRHQSASDQYEIGDDQEDTNDYYIYVEPGDFPKLTNQASEQNEIVQFHCVNSDSDSDLENIKQLTSRKNKKQKKRSSHSNSTSSDESSDNAVRGSSNIDGILTYSLTDNGNNELLNPSTQSV